MPIKYICKYNTNLSYVFELYLSDKFTSCNPFIGTTLNETTLNENTLDEKKEKLSSIEYFTDKKLITFNNIKNNETIPKIIMLDCCNIISFEIGKLIQEGGYGKIYQISIICEELGKIIKFNAVNKYINKISMIGLLEPYIMLHLNSKFLIKSLKIFRDVYGNYNIIQPIADLDLGEHVRKLNKTLSDRKLKKWAWQIVCGIAALHSKGILHGDIKARNILIFDDEVRIADFGISIFILDHKKGIYIQDYLYTPTHRSIEIFEDKNFSFSADIWALGCTLYEMAYNDLLFKDLRQNTNYTRETLNHLYINIFKDLNISKVLSKKERGKDFKNLLGCMLDLNPKKRINIWDIINHPYFEDIKSEEDLPKERNFKEFIFPELYSTISKNFFTGIALKELSIKSPSTDNSLEKNFTNAYFSGYSSPSNSLDVSNKSLEDTVVYNYHEKYKCFDVNIINYSLYLYYKTYDKINELKLENINLNFEVFIILSYKLLYTVLPENLKNQSSNVKEGLLFVHKLLNFEFYIG